MDQPDIRDPEMLLESARMSLKPLREIIFGFGEAQTIIRSMSGIIRYWSRGAERLYGWTSDEAVGRSAPDLLQTVSNVQPCEVTECLLRDRVWHGELIHRHRNGTEIHVASDWVLQSNDGVENIIEISNDITGRVQDDATRRLYAAIVADSDDAIIGKTLDGLITSWNGAAEKMFGWKAAEIIGRSITLIIPPDKIVEEQTIAAKLRQGLRVEHFETIRQHRSGALLQIALTVSPIRSASGDIVGASKILRDIGFQRQSAVALQRAQRMEAIAQLTGGVAHDFNNLLGVIMASADVLRPSVAHDPILLGIVDDILVAAVGGGRLTGRLISFARHRTAPMEAIDLGAYLSTYTELLRRTLGGAIVITTEFAAGLWLACADASQIGDALINLALNARDAMPETGGWLRIKIANVHLPYHKHHPGDYVVISVADDGSGMPPEVLAHALEPFFTTKPENIGNGLGLSMVAGTMARHNGRVEIESEAGAGTTIKLFLPRAAPTVSVPVTTVTRGEVEPEMLRGTETILVVDDNEQLRHTVVRTLSSLGYRTEEASDGQSALRLLEGGMACDLLLSDIIMPGGLTGSQLVAKARELRPGLRCMLTTGFARLTDIPGESSDVAILHKPYRRQTLAAAVRTALDAPRADQLDVASQHP